jgi:THO complex subunit 5
LHPLSDFLELAPEEARTEDVLVLENEHQLMLNRLSFELAERHRCGPVYLACPPLRHAY